MTHTQSLLTWEQIHACPGPTPSYHELPPQIPRRVGSQRSYAESLVLNDDLVSQTIGSEDFSYSVSVCARFLSHRGVAHATQPVRGGAVPL